MTHVKIDFNALVLVGDGKKALFFRNKGDARHPNLVVERVLEHDDAPTREQGTDQPGRTAGPPGPARSAVEPTDWHQLGEDRFAKDIAAALYRRAHAGGFDKLVVVAPPKVLGILRKEMHKEVTERITAEVPKELTGHPVSEIEKLLTE
jgi:protein required for attachment to host cells